MIMRHNTARAARIKRCLLRFSWQRLFLPLLMGMLVLAAGCAKKQPAQLPDPSASSRMEKKLDVIEVARSNIGVPYKFGGTSPTTGFDCSGLVCWSYQQVGIQLPRTASDQIMFGIKVDRREELEPGDIVVFKGTRGRTGWHSGIYTGDGKFVHSPTTGKTVTEDRLDDKYYAQRFAGARRIPRDGSATELYAQYEAQQRANALAAKNSRKSRKQIFVAANAKSNAKGKASASSSSKKPGKSITAQSGKPNGAATASTAGAVLADAGVGRGAKANNDSSAVAGKTGKQPESAEQKPRAAGSTAKNASEKKDAGQERLVVASATAKPGKQASVTVKPKKAGQATNKGKKAS